MCNKGKKKSIIFMSNMYPSDEFPAFGTFVRTNERHLQEQGLIISKKIVIDRKGGSKIKKSLRYIRYISRSLYCLIFSKYDFAYIHYLTYSTIPLLLLLPFKKIKYVINIHGDDLTGEGRIHKLMGGRNKYLINNAVGIVVPSEYFKEKLISFVPEYDKRNVHVSYSGGVDTDRFRPSPQISRKNDFIYLSRIEEGKGWEVLLKAIFLLKDDFKEISVDIYGDGIQKNDFLKMVCELGLTKNVTFKGAITYNLVPQVLSDYKFFIFPTYRESLGLAFLEAMACGIPGIVSDIEPLNSISNPHASFFFNVGDAVKLVEKMSVSLSLSDENYRRMSSENIRISQAYSGDKSKIRLVRFLDDVINNT